MKLEKIQFNGKLDFISEYHNRLKIESNKIKNELPYSAENPKPKKGLNFVQFKDIKNSWTVKDLLYGDNFYESENLKLLANKINRMIIKGNAEGVKRMVESFFTTGIKKLSQPPSKEAIENKYHNRFSEFIGYGHFREDWKAVTLTEFELKRVKEYFNINI